MLGRESTLGRGSGMGGRTASKPDAGISVIVVISAAPSHEPVEAVEGANEGPLNT